MAQGLLQLPTTGTVSGLQNNQDANAALAALASDTQGAAAPTPASTGLASTAGVKWHDTAANLDKVRDQADSTFIVKGAFDETNKLYTPVATPIYGLGRNVMAQCASAGGTSFTLKFDEFVGKTAAGGTALLAVSGNLTVNLAGTGADGLDTGALAANKLYRTYLLLKIADGTLHTLSTLDTNAAPSPVPAGFTLLSVVAYCLTDGSGKILPFTQYDRKFWYQTPVNVASGVSYSGSLAAQSVAAAVPAQARFASVLAGFTTSTGAQLLLAADGTGTGAATLNLSGVGGVTFFGFNGFGSVEIPILTAQTIFIAENGGPVGTGRISASGFSF
jgi:hypothetical protein